AVNALPPDLSELNRLDRNLQENHNDFASLLGMGQRLMAAGFWGSGSSYYSPALRHHEARRDPPPGEVLLREAGEAYLELKDAKRSAQVFEACVKEFPHSRNRPDSMLNLARAYLLGKRKDRARKTLADLIEEFPKSESGRQARVLVSGL